MTRAAIRDRMSKIGGMTTDICDGLQHQGWSGDLPIGLVSRRTVRHIIGMNRQARPPTLFSKVSVKCRTVIPREVRERLGLKAGDTYVTV